MEVLLTEQRVTFDKKAYPKNGWAIMMSGIPGAGKSTAIKNYLLIDAKVLDSDRIKTLALNKVKTDIAKGNNTELVKSMLEHFNGKIPELSNEEDSQEIHNFLIKEKRLFSNYVKQFLRNKSSKENFIIDATGNNAKTIDKYGNLFKTLGYKICVVLVATELKIAKERAINRKNSEGRAVTEEYIEQIYNSLIKKFPNMLDSIDTNVVDEFWVILNSNEFSFLEKKNNCIKLKKENGKFVIDDALLKQVQASKRENIFKFFDKVVLSASRSKATMSVKKPINSEEELKKLLETDYSEAYNKAKNGDIIYRGADNYTKNCLAIEYIPGKRISESTTNIYTKLLSDIFPSWSKFPKRNRSIIASFNLENASEYGLEHIVLPKNGAKIAICPDTDIWYSFSDNGSFNELYNFNNEFVRTAAYVLKKPSKQIENAFIKETNDDVINLLNELNIKFLEMCKNNNIINSLMQDYFDEWVSNPSLLYSDYLENVFFNNSRFKIQNISEIQSDDNSEVWFEGPSIFIPVDSELLLESLNINVNS